MIVGVPHEIKQDEYRVAILPVGVEEFVRRGHHVLVESGAGLGSGLPDHEYLQQGAEMVSSGADVYARADSRQKRKAFEKAYVDLNPNVDKTKHWEKDGNLLSWLKSLNN